MGTDKALVDFGGRPLIAHAIGILAAARLPVSIAGARPESSEALSVYAPVIADAERGLGPLSGVCAALASTAARFGVFLPVDVPLMPPSLIAWLLDRARITDAAFTLASVNGRAQTFPAVVSQRALPALKNELCGRRLGCLAAFHAAARELGESVVAVSAEVLVQSGHVSHPQALPVVRWFLNFNTGDDLRLALSLRPVRVS